MNLFLHIGNWINTAISMGVIKDIYWVLPDWTKEEAWKDSFWKEQDLCCNDNEHLSNVMLDAPSDKVFYYEKSNRKIHFSKPFDCVHNAQKYIPINFHKIVIGDLPDMKNKDNVMFDICGDYFINSGMSTVNKANNIKSFSENEDEITRSFNEMFTQLDNKHIKPFIYTGAKSKGFVPDEHLAQVSCCLKSIDQFKASNQSPKKLSIIV